MLQALRSRLFRAFGNWCIRRAKRTPYLHLFHDDGRPYMERYWLLRIGRSASSDGDTVYPWFGIRVHRIQSSDDRVFHDHPWTFITWILRGGYTEVVPLDGHGVVRTGHRFTAGSLRRVRAQQWHYLTLPPGEEAWTLFITFRKRQSWGFLVNGVKVPWREYLAHRVASKKACGA